MKTSTVTLISSMLATRRAARRAPVAFVAFLVLFALAAQQLALPLRTSARAALAPEATDEQASHQNGPAELHQALLDLRNPWTVMCVAAHPDDEDGATLTVLRRKYGAHTVTLFSTYGEGGQNAIGPQLYEELGAIRERETREAAEIQGSEPYFLGLRDFGFSKSAEEAFRVWGHEEALRRMVRKIRELRPDVIITNHDTTGGHGHHQATGRLILEAFDVAADPSRFPEQLREGLSAWQAKRLFVRMSYEGLAASKALDAEAERAGRVAQLDINERDPVRGTTYAEQALQALRRHASQGPWPQTLPPGGRPPIRYRLARESKDAPPLPAHPQTFLDGLTLAPSLAAAFAAPTINGQPLTDFPDQRARILDALISARRNGLFAANVRDAEAARFRLMTERLDRALALAAGVDVKLTPREEVVSRGMRVHLNLHIADAGPKAARLRDVVTGCGRDRHGLDFRRLKLPTELRPGATFDVEEASYVTPDVSINVPRSEHLYDGHLLGERCASEASLEIDGARFRLASAAQVDVAPEVEIKSVTPSPLVLTPGSRERPLDALAVQLTSHLPEPFNGNISLRGQGTTHGASAQVGPGFTLQPGETREVRVEPPAPGRFGLAEGAEGAHHSVSLQLSITRPMKGGKVAEVTQRTIPFVWADARVAPGLRVGYVSSYDETLRNALAALGLKADELSMEDVRSGRLETYDTIIIDNRGYQAHPELVAVNARLLDYVRAGGTLVVFYHKNFEWNPDPQRGRPQLAPYPITLGGERVTDENAPVTFTEPQHPLLNSPNKLGPDDFKDWIQERGLYYPKAWDAHYSAPLSAADPGEEQLRGGLLAADYGRGRYIYTSMVWYRQLRAGIPGAYRVFANMISYGHAAASAGRK